MQIVSSFIPFPPISWWAHVVAAEGLVLDSGEHFEKMTFRNKYQVAGANNPILLSLPLVKGRNQRTPMAEVMICNDTAWQLQHWRALVSTYRQSPYWEYLEAGLEPLFATSYVFLKDFNLAALQWAMRQMKLHLPISIAASYRPDYGDSYKDLRSMKSSSQPRAWHDFPRYYQMFEERIGFLPDLSIIDLLCAEGPRSRDWLTANRQAIVGQGRGTS